MSKFTDVLYGYGFKSYEEYLRSDHWSEFKKRYAASGRPMRCVVCRAKRIQLHHHTYERLGHERLSDVTPLCGEHHKNVHFILKIRGWFVEHTAKAIEVIVAQLPRKKPQVKPKQTKPNHQKGKYREPLLSLAAEFASLKKDGFYNEHVPANYDPMCGDGRLRRFVKILRRAKKNQRYTPPIAPKIITPPKPTKPKKRKRLADYWNGYINLSKQRIAMGDKATMQTNPPLCLAARVVSPAIKKGQFRLPCEL